jgi:hypothetical protein
MYMGVVFLLCFPCRYEVCDNGLFSAELEAPVIRTTIPFAVVDVFVISLIRKAGCHQYQE